LPFGDAEKRFLVAVIAFDLPAIDVGLEELLEVEVGIGADEEGGLAVQQASTGAESLADRFDDHQHQRSVGSGLGPKHGPEDFNLEVARLAGGVATDGLKGNRIVL